MEAGGITHHHSGQIRKHVSAFWPSATVSFGGKRQYFYKIFFKKRDFWWLDKVAVLHQQVS